MFPVWKTAGRLQRKTVAKVLVEEFICRYGIPKELHSDQGRNFESKLMSEVCTLLGVKKTRTCPLHPRGDGFIERFNRTLISMVASILDPDRHQTDWDERIPYAMLAYRSAVQESTGETPAMMMMGREIMLPVDIVVTQPTPVEMIRRLPRLRDRRKKRTRGWWSGVRQRRCMRDRARRTLF